MLTTKQAAEYLGVSYYYLRNMRHQLHSHEGPKYIEGKSPRGKTCYSTIESLDEWAKSHKWRIVKWRSKSVERMFLDSSCLHPAQFPAKLLK